MKSIGKTIVRGFVNLIMLLFSFSCIFPILWLLSSSLKTQQEFAQSSMALPSALNLKNYISVFTETNMLRYIVNSLRNTVLSVGLIIIMAFTAAYVLSRYKFKGRNFIYNYFIIGMLIPIHALLVPMYVQFKQAGLTNHWYTLLLPYISCSVLII